MLSAKVKCVTCAVETGQNLAVAAWSCLCRSSPDVLIHIMILNVAYTRSDADSHSLTKKAHAQFAESRGVTSQSMHVRLVRLPRCSVQTKFYSKASFLKISTPKITRYTVLPTRVLRMRRLPCGRSSEFRTILLAHLFVEVLPLRLRQKRKTRITS